MFWVYWSWRNCHCAGASFTPAESAWRRSRTFCARPLANSPRMLSGAFLTCIRVFTGIDPIHLAASRSVRSPPLSVTIVRFDFAAPARSVTTDLSAAPAPEFTLSPLPALSSSMKTESILPAICSRTVPPSRSRTSMSGGRRMM